GDTHGVVSRRRRLRAVEAPAAITLDPLPAGEAADLRARLAGRAELAFGAGPARELTRLCGYLPLAIGMLARQLRHHPAWTVAGMGRGRSAAPGARGRVRPGSLGVAAPVRAV